MLIAAMHHAGLTTALDDRHFGLLSLIVLMWMVWFYVGIRAERDNIPAVAVAVAIGVALGLATFSLWLGLGAAQWIVCAALGVAWERKSGR